MVSISLKTRTRHFSLQSVVWNCLHPARLPKWMNKLLLKGTKTKCKTLGLIWGWLKQSRRCALLRLSFASPVINSPRGEVRGPLDQPPRHCSLSHLCRLSFTALIVTLIVVNLNHHHHNYSNIIMTTKTTILHHVRFRDDSQSCMTESQNQNTTKTRTKLDKTNCEISILAPISAVLNAGFLLFTHQVWFRLAVWTTIQSVSTNFALSAAWVNMHEFLFI